MSSGSLQFYNILVTSKFKNSFNTWLLKNKAKTENKMYDRPKKDHFFLC